MVVGSNVSSANDVIHYYDSKLLMPHINGLRDSIAMIDDGLHSIIPLDKFQVVVSLPSILCGHTTAVTVTPGIFIIQEDEAHIP